MPERIETERLLLRPLEHADLEPLWRIHGDEQAMRFTFSPDSPEASEQNLRAYAALSGTHGFAPWTALLRASGRVVGWGGLNVDPHAPGWGVEVSYFFDPAFHGRGLASELVAAALTHGFGELELSAIGAFARPENAASARVLEKNGFRLLGFVAELERNHYEIRSCDWQRRPDT